MMYKFQPWHRTSSSKEYETLPSNSLLLMLIDSQSKPADLLQSQKLKRPLLSAQLQKTTRPQSKSREVVIHLAVVPLI